MLLYSIFSYAMMNISRKGNKFMFVKKYFGDMRDGKPVFLFETQNTHGTKIQILNYGGIIKSLQVSDRTGEKKDIVLGHDTLAGYESQDKYFGALIGRCANRIGGSRFSIGGKDYFLNANEGNNHLHGGLSGFDKKIWTAETAGNTLRLSYTSVDGEEGYPGTLTVTVTYMLTEDNELSIEYHAVSDQDTVVSLTDHSYFNLNGHGSGSIEKHLLKVNACLMTPVNEEMIPLGSMVSVDGTPFNFRNFHAIGERINDSDEQLHIGGGYDHNYIIEGKGLRPAAELIGDESGIQMTVYTDMDGIQLYTGNFIEGAPTGKGGVCYHNRDAVCLETQFFPNAINCPAFPSPLLCAGEVYHHRTIYQFKTI